MLGEIALHVSDLFNINRPISLLSCIYLSLPVSLLILPQVRLPGTWRAAWRGRQCSFASRRQVRCLLSAAIRLLGITRGVSFRVRGQSSPHRAKQRLSAGRARDHPVMEIVPNKALSLSLSLSLTGYPRNGSHFGLWRVCFPPVLIRPARRLPVEALR